MELIPGLNYYIGTEEGFAEMQKTRKPNPLAEKINYHTELTSVKILLENMKRLHPRLTEDTMEGLAYLSVHPALSDEQRYFYKHKLETLVKKCQEDRTPVPLGECIQTRRSCQSPVNQQVSNTMEHISLTSDTI